MKIGSGVSKISTGDRVILGWIKGKGMDVPGTKYRKGDTTINARGVTTFSDYTMVSENRCVKLPEGIALDEAVLFGCAIPTGAGIVMNRIKPQLGSTLAMFGLGGIGLSALMMTGFYKCSKIIAVDIGDEKLRLATELGATHTVNPKFENPLEAIKRITDGKGVDYSIESSGLAKTIEQAFQSVKKFGGLCVFASHPEFGKKRELDPHDLISGKRIEGSWGGSTDPDNDIPKLAELHREKPQNSKGIN